jgi:nucleoside-diphosphate-sugar epimerase
LNLIVGGTGFIGGHLAEYFFEQAEISKGIFRKGSHLRIMDQSGIQCLEADLMDRTTLHEPLEGVETVYSLASPTPKDGENQDYLGPNTQGIMNLLAEAKEHGIKRFVHLSTLDVYGLGRHSSIDASSTPSPTHPYQKAKLAADKLVAEFAGANPGIKVRIVRAARAVGARDRTLTVPILRMASQGRILLPAGDSTASFSHPRDIAQALLKAANADGGNGPIIQPVKSFDASPAELAETMAKAVGKNARVKQSGLFSGRTALPDYTVSQLRASLHLEEKDAWKRSGYAPSYGLEKVATEVALWFKKEPWNVEEN